ncbi:MAG: toll/interleukin-1 receptor domain-containing protein [Chloroflexi bacterium]|nr:toll/interleukin-1 receptor domain-containing protein [Chloroflexota bacterium]
MTDRKSVFISYAHKDGLDFTRRLSYSLSMYMDVFWDRRLPAANYPRELEAQIEGRDYLLLVMTPFSIVSEWCQRELQHAESHGKGIVLARIFNGDGTTHPQWISKYTFGDFTEDFDAGFRRVSTMMLGQPLSSWEYLAESDDQIVIQSLRHGILPSAISKHIAEWLIVEKLWGYVETIADDFERAKEAKGAHVRIRRGQPRTARGVLISLGEVQKRFQELGYRNHVEVIGAMSFTAANAMEHLSQTPDDDNKEAGNTAFNLFTQVRGNMVNQSAKVLDADLARYGHEYLEFDLAEKLRELINMYARRSRYLY